MGNLRSVEKALEHVGADVTSHRRRRAAADADGLVLPGVGAFPKAMERVRELGFDRLIDERVEAGNPGARHLPRHAAPVRALQRARRGRGPGPARRATVEPLDAPGPQGPAHGLGAGALERDSAIREGIDSETPFYFVHSLTPRPADEDGRPRHGRPRRALRLRGRAAAALRLPVPPREVERRRASACSPTSPASAPSRVPA